MTLKAYGENPPEPVERRPKPTKGRPMTMQEQRAFLPQFKPKSAQEQYAEFDLKPFVNLSQLSELLSLPEEWLGSLAKAGKIPYLLVAGGSAFDVESVYGALVELSKDRNRGNHERL